VRRIRCLSLILFVSLTGVPWSAGLENDFFFFFLEFFHSQTTQTQPHSTVLFPSPFHENEFFESDLKT
jgi:hypothetical protein